MVFQLIFNFTFLLFIFSIVGFVYARAKKEPFKIKTVLIASIILSLLLEAARRNGDYQDQKAAEQSQQQHQ